MKDQGQLILRVTIGWENVLWICSPFQSGGGEMASNIVSETRDDCYCYCFVYPWEWPIDLSFFFIGQSFASEMDESEC